MYIWWGENPHWSEGHGLHSLLKLYAPTWWRKRLFYVSLFLFFTLDICRWNDVQACVFLLQPAVLMRSPLKLEDAWLLQTTLLVVSWSNRCIILSKRNPWFVCFSAAEIYVQYCAEVADARRHFGWECHRKTNKTSEKMQKWILNLTFYNAQISTFLCAERFKLIPSK